MKQYYLLFLLLIGAILFMSTNPSQKIPQAQEAPPTTEEIGLNTYRIKLDIDDVIDKSVADIVWFKMVSKFAIKKKIPWFNVIEEKMTDTEVEGIIQLEPDQMKAEYDANEILGLQLNDEYAE